MKKSLLLFFLLALGVMPVLAKKSPAEKAAGTYNGLLFIGMNEPVNDATESSEASIKLEAETDNTVKFTLPNFKYGTMNLGDIVLTGIPVSEDESGRIVFGKNDPQSLSISIVTANVNIDETTSYIDADYANIDVFVSTRIVFSNVSIYVRFQGNNGEYKADGVAQQIEGTRQGNTYSQYDGKVSATSPRSETTLTVTAIDAQTVKFVLGGAEVQGVELGDITFATVSVAANADGTVKLGDAQATGSIMGAMDYTLTLNGTKSYWSADSVGLDIDADVAGMPFHIVFTTGTLYDTNRPVVTTGPAAEVAGSYNAGIYVSLGTPVTSDTEKFTDAEILLTAQDENTVTFTLKDFSLDGVNSLGDIVLKDIPVIDNEDGTYKFGANDPQSVSLGGGAITADVKIDETTSYVAGDNLYINVPVQAMGEYIYVHVGLPVVTDVITGPAAEVAGSYNAGIYVSLGTPVTSDTEKFTDAEILLTAQDENTVTFTLKDFSLDGVNSLGDIVLKDIPVIDNEDGTYKFGANNPQSVSLAGGAITADVKIDETTSYVAGEDLYIDVPVQAMGEYIYVHVGLPVTTGITTITTRTLSDGIIYDLSGRRLTQRPTRPGVYIVGGRKVYFK